MTCPYGIFGNHNLQPSVARFRRKARESLPRTDRAAIRPASQGDVISLTVTA